MEARADGIDSIVGKFVKGNPDISKRQIEIKIKELATKVRLETDTKLTWRLKQEYEKYLDNSVTLPVPAASHSTPKQKTPSKRKVEDSETKAEANLESTPTAKEPKKFKRAFGLFVKDHREEAEAQLGASAEVRFVICIFSL